MIKPNSTGNSVSKVAVVGNYLPRKCGIATFTTDTCNALAAELKNSGTVSAVAMNDLPRGYDYPERVKFTIRQNNQTDYYWAADYLNTNKYEVVILEHEYGIFGGDSGSFILHMLRALKMPVVVNLHTVLENPTNRQLMVMNEIIKNCDCLTVMSNKAVSILKENYNLDGRRIEVIPHGIPDVSFKQPGVHNKVLGLEGRKMLFSFGLLGPGKGLEYIIETLPGVVEKHPDVAYVILGQTHPNIIRESGEAYRHSLQLLVNKLGLTDHVFFHNTFVSEKTLVKYLQSADGYLIAYPNKQQITSGTLAFAVGSGCAVVSTPFWHAEELLAEDRGFLVPYGDRQSYTEAINSLLENDQQTKTMRLLAYQQGRSMTYKEVSRKILDLCAELRSTTKEVSGEQEIAQQSFQLLNELPKIKLDHFEHLTDDTGMFQHAQYSIPNYFHGYCIDDNARALIFACIHYKLYKKKKMLPLINRYLAFLFYAFNRENNRFRNFMSYDRRWLELAGSDDSHARTIWALGMTIKYSPNQNIRNFALELFLDSLSVAQGFPHSRSIAFTILGLDAYLYKYSGDASARKLRNDLAEKLYAEFKKNATDAWPWPEDTLTYANAKLSHALIVAGQWIPNPEMFEMGRKSLEWLLEIQTHSDGHLSIIGNQGWYKKGEPKATYDQQAIEAMCLVDACVDMYQVTKEKKWLDGANRSLAWFLGRNDNNVPIYDFETGGCCDGLMVDGVNPNQGAESTLSWLLSLVRMYELVGMSGVSFGKDDVAAE